MPCAWGARAGLLRAVRGHAGKFALSTTHAHDVLTAYPYGAPRAALSLLDGLRCYSPCACHAPSAYPPPPSRPLHLDIGCARGLFCLDYAEENPQVGTPT